MIQQTHILNGDALLNQLSELFEGEKIVCRECMIEGNRHGKTPDEIFKNRAIYIQETYNVDEPEYFKGTKNELLRIQEIPKQNEINLWFEDDLFCQTNFWFVAHLLHEYKLENPIFLVRPSHGNEYNFGEMNESDLNDSLNSKTQITIENLNKLNKLWRAYQQNNNSEMIKIAQSLNSHFPFVGPAIYANISNSLRLPEKSLKQIIADLNTTEFGPIFKEFCKREAIYGFGDSQVQRMFDRIIEQRNEQ